MFLPSLLTARVFIKLSVTPCPRSPGVSAWSLIIPDPSPNTIITRGLSLVRHTRLRPLIGWVWRSVLITIIQAATSSPHDTDLTRTGVSVTANPRSVQRVTGQSEARASLTLTRLMSRHLITLLQDQRKIFAKIKLTLHIRSGRNRSTLKICTGNSTNHSIQPMSQKYSRPGYFLLSVECRRSDGDFLLFQIC